MARLPVLVADGQDLAVGAALAAAAEMGTRRFGRVNWLGLMTLAERENRRFLAVWTQTLLAPLITAGLFMVIFSIAIGQVPRCRR